MDATPDVDTPSLLRAPSPSLAGVTRTVVAALERWRHWVRQLPLVATDEHATALRGLVAWYERVCVDEHYASAPPAEGMEALLLTEQEGSSATAIGLVAARWALRVAEELAAYRQAAAQSQEDAGARLVSLEAMLHQAQQRLSSAGSHRHR